MPELHHIAFNGECSKATPHDFRDAYQLDGFVPKTNLPRWLLYKVCRRCKGFYAYAISDTNPKKRYTNTAS